jgi:hypothetical protein
MDIPEQLELFEKPDSNSQEFLDLVTKYIDFILNEHKMIKRK